MRKNCLFIFFVLAILIAAFSGCSKAGSKGEIKLTIGAVLPLSGALGQHGRWVAEGIEVALLEVKERCPIVSVSVLYEDSQGDAKNAVAAFHKLAAQKVDVVFVLTSGETLAVAPLSEKYGLPLFTGTLIPSITMRSPYIVRNGASMEAETGVMANYLAKQGQPSVGLLYVNNEVGTFSAENFVRLYENAGGVITDQESYFPGNNDFRGVLTKLKEKEPDVLLFYSYSEWATLVKQARELGMKCQFAGATPTENADAIKAAGNSAEGVIYTRAAYDPDENVPELLSFQKLYREKFGRPAEVWAATFRDNVIILASLFSKGTPKNGDDLVSKVVALGVFNGASGETFFLENRDTRKPVGVFKISNGDFGIKVYP